MSQSTWNTGSTTPYHNSSAFSGSRTPAAWDAGGRTPAYGAPTPGVYGSAPTPGAPTPGAYGASTSGGGGEDDGYE